MLSCETTRMQRGQDSPVDPPAATTGLGVDVVSPRRPGHIPRGLAGGILTAIGGFLDIGDLVTNAVVGSRFVLSLLAWAVVVGVVGICVFAQMSGRVAAVSGRATFEHGLVTRLAGAAGRTRRNWLPPPSRPNRPGRPKGRARGRWPCRGTWDYQVINCGSRRVLTISLQIMINLRFSL
jgi:hypothetical protein